MSRYRTHDAAHDGGGWAGTEAPEGTDFVSCRLETTSGDRIRIEMHYDAVHNCVELRCPEGQLVIVPRVSNEVRVYVNTHWDKDELKI